MSKFVAVWMSHTEARVFHIEAAHTETEKLSAPSHHIFHTHPPKGAEGTKAHDEESQKFFHELTTALEGTDSLLIVGPSTGKLAFIRYLHTHAKALEAKVVGVETVDHPTDGQLVAYAKKYVGMVNHGM